MLVPASFQQFYAHLRRNLSISCWKYIQLVVVGLFLAYYLYMFFNLPSLLLFAGLVILALRGQRIASTFLTESMEGATVIDCHLEKKCFPRFCCCSGSCFEERVLTICYQVQDHEITKSFRCSSELDWTVGEELSDPSTSSCRMHPDYPLSAIPSEIIKKYNQFPVPPICLAFNVVYLVVYIQNLCSFLYRSFLSSDALSSGWEGVLYFEIMATLLATANAWCAWKFFSQPPEYKSLKSGNGHAFGCTTQVISVKPACVHETWQLIPEMVWKWNSKRHLLL